MASGEDPKPAPGHYGHYLPGKAYDKPKALKPLVRKLVNVLRVLSLGRHHRRSFHSSSARFAGRRLSDPYSEGEQAFLAKVLSFVPLMARSGKLMLPFLTEAGNKSGDLAATTIHQVKILTARAVWKDLVEPLKEEIEKSKTRHTSLQEVFNETRSEYLREVAALRDEVRVRGDPEKALAQGQMKDVMFFFEPMKTLQPHELQYCLEVVKEKLKMIFEENAAVTQTVNFGQLDRLKELLVNAEVAKHREILNRKTAEILELERDRRHLQRELAIVSKGYRDAQVSLEAANYVSESNVATMSQETEKLRAEIGSLKETRFRRESMLKKTTDELRAAQLERDDAMQEMKSYQQKLGEAEVQLQGVSQEMEAIRREVRLLENQEALLAEQLERQRAHGEILVQENIALRKTVGRWQEKRRRSLLAKCQQEAPEIAGESGIAEPLVGAEEVGERSEDPTTAPEESQEAPESSNPLAEEAKELISKLRECDEQLQDSFAERSRMSSRLIDAEMENKRLRKALEEQAQYVVQHSAEMQLQHADALAKMMGRLRGSKDGAGQGPIPTSSLPPMQADGPSSPQPPPPPSPGQGKAWTSRPTSAGVRKEDSGTTGMDRLHDELLSLSHSGPRTSQAGDQPGDATHDQERLGAEAASAVVRMQDRMQKLRKLTTAMKIQAMEQEMGSMGDGDPEDEPASPRGPLAAAVEAAAAVQDLHSELDDMCDVTAAVAAALRSSVEENVKTREAVAMLNDQVRMAEEALKSSPALEKDEHLQRCLLKVQHLKHSTTFYEVSGVFGRLWRDSLDRQARKTRRAFREKAVESTMSGPYVLSPEAGAAVAAALSEPKNDGSEVAPQGEPPPELLARRCSLPSPVRPEGSRQNSRRRASASEAVHASWGEPIRSQSIRSQNLYLPPAAAPLGSALVIKAVTPSPGQSPRSPSPEEPEVDDLATVSSSQLRLVHRSPRPRSASALQSKATGPEKAELTLEQAFDQEDPLCQARARPRVVPPLAERPSSRQSTGGRAASKSPRPSI